MGCLITVKKESSVTSLFRDWGGRVGAHSQIVTVVKRGALCLLLGYCVVKLEVPFMSGANFSKREKISKLFHANNAVNQYLLLKKSTLLK